MKLIVLMTDFGTKDTYVAEMKAAIWAIAPEAKILDLTHQIEPQNVKQAAFMLSTSFERFPEGSVFVSVVDPSVGTKRQMLAARAANRYFVGPDNGSFAFLNDIHEAEIRKIENSEYFAKSVSSTFHGRDIFAPVAAHIANSQGILQLGKKLERAKNIEGLKPIFTKNSVSGEIMWLDHFGNAISNIKFSTVASVFSLGKIYVYPTNENGKARKIRAQLANTFADGQNSENVLLAYEGSKGYLEFALWNASASAKLGINIGTSVEIIAPE